MVDRSATGVAALLLAGTLALAAAGANAAESPQYPDWSGAWARFVVPGLGGQPSFDQTKPWGKGQQAPLTAEYQKILEDSIADQAQGGEGNYIDHARCLAAGMPLMMIAFRPLEFVVTPKTTYILIGSEDHYRRIFTDGRSLAQGDRADLCGLFDRPLDRCGRRRPLRHARSRDPRVQGTACL